MDSSIQSPCSGYIVTLNPETGEPLLGTMRLRPNTKLDPGFNTCNEAPVPSTQVSLSLECRPASRLRYFYLVNSQTGKVVPNSMFTRTTGPTNMCTSVNNVLEFVVQQHA
jgi:hypothetical protein